MNVDKFTKAFSIFLLISFFSVSAFASTGWLSTDFYGANDDPAYFQRSGEYINNFSVQYLENEWVVSTNGTEINITTYGNLSKTNYTFVEAGVSDGTANVDPSGYNSSGFVDKTLNVTNITTQNATVYAIVKGDWLYRNPSREDDYQNTTSYDEIWNLTVEDGFSIINAEYVYDGNETVQGEFSNNKDSVVYTYPNDLDFTSHTRSWVVNSPTGVPSLLGGVDTWSHYIDTSDWLGVDNTKQLTVPYYSQAKSWADSNNVTFELESGTDLPWSNPCQADGFSFLCVWEDYSYNSSAYGWGISLTDRSNISIEPYLKVDNLTSTSSSASWNVTPRQPEYESIFLNEYIDTFYIEFPITNNTSEPGLYYPDLDKSKDYEVYWDGVKQEHYWNNSKLYARVAASHFSELEIQAQGPEPLVTGAFFQMAGTLITGLVALGIGLAPFLVYDFSDIREQPVRFFLMWAVGIIVAAAVVNYVTALLGVG